MWLILQSPQTISSLETRHIKSPNTQSLLIHSSFFTILEERSRGDDGRTERGCRNDAGATLGVASRTCTFRVRVEHLLKETPVEAHSACCSIVQGVQIETSEERRAGRVAHALQEANALSEEEEEEISYVLVPADTSRPLQELTVRVPQTSTGDLLVEHLRQAFASNSSKTVDISLLQAQKTLVGLTGTPTSVSDETLQKVASEASVETFALVHPMPSNQFTGINIYLDEVGMLKRLPLNTRASAYAERAGFNPPPTLYGDVFLGRIKLKPAIRNVSFVLGIDTAMDSAPWLKSAQTENLEYQMEMNRITGRKDTQPTVAGSGGKVKEEVGFTWTQTEEELEVCVPLPSPDATSKQMQVKFHPQSLEVMFQNRDLVPTMRLFERIDADAATWTIDRAASPPQIVITMEKMVQALWPRILD